MRYAIHREDGSLHHEIEVADGAPPYVPPKGMTLRSLDADPLREMKDELAWLMAPADGPTQPIPPNLPAFGTLAPTGEKVGSDVAPVAPKFDPHWGEQIKPQAPMASDFLQTEMTDSRETIAAAKDRLWDEYNDLLNKSGGGFASADEQKRLRHLSANLADFRKAV